MGALLEAAVTAPPSSIALKLAKDIHWIRVSTIIIIKTNYNILSHDICHIIDVIIMHTVILLVMLCLVELYATIKMNQIMFGICNAFILTRHRRHYWVI